MKSLLAMAVLFSVLMAQNAALQAQGVFVTRGENGPVFSDKPQPGAKEVTLKPLNVIAPTKAPAVAAPAVANTGNENTDAAAPAYRSFSVVSPENNGSIVANTAVFEVRVAVDPALQLGDGHAFVVSINGRPVGQRFTVTEFMIPPEFWGDTLPAANQNLQLNASIVDANGQVLKQAAPVRFFMRYATVLNHPRRLVPLPVRLAKPATLKPQVAQEPAAATTMKRLDK